MRRRTHTPHVGRNPIYCICRIISRFTFQSCMQQRRVRIICCGSPEVCPIYSIKFPLYGFIDILSQNQTAFIYNYTILAQKYQYFFIL